MNKPVAPWWFTSAFQAYITVMTSVVIIVTFDGEADL